MPGERKPDMTEDDRVELLDGEVVPKMVMGSRHAACVNRLNRLFVPRAGDDYVVAVQNPVVLPASQPEPDVAVLRWRDDLYAAAHPRVEDVVVLVGLGGAGRAAAGVTARQLADPGRPCVS